MITFKQFAFEAAHQTPPFSALHGHSFKCEVHFEGEVDPVYGWSANLNQVERTIEGIRNLVDHRYLNDVPGLEVPSLENVARWLWQRLDAELPGVKSVKLCRGNDGGAEGCIYSGERDRPVRRAVRELDAVVAG